VQVFVERGDVDHPPDDNRMLEAAVAGNADVIVTGDADLLEDRSCPICPPPRVTEAECVLSSRWLDARWCALRRLGCSVPAMVGRS
jgi:hypothetical protein